MDFNEYIVIDIETTGFIEKGVIPDIVCYSWCDSEGSGASTVIQTLQVVIGDKIPVFHNAKFDVPILRHYGIEIDEYHDSMIMSYVLDTSLKHNLRACAERVGSEKLVHDWDGEVVWSDELAEYAEQDAIATWEVFKNLAPQILQDKDNWNIYSLELQFLERIIEYEKNGLPVDVTEAENYHDELELEINVLKRDITKKYPKVPSKKLKTYKKEHPELEQFFHSNPDEKEWNYQLYEPFNYNSTHHKAWILQQEGWKPIEFCKTGTPKLDAAVITSIEDKYPTAKIFQDLSGLHKTLNTFVLALLDNRDENDFVHTSVNQTVTRTGRLSSCVAEWTRVKTKRGLVQIKDLIPGDEVWTHKRRWKPVLGLQVKPDDTMVNITFCNGDVLTCTLYHKLNVPGIGWKTIEEIINEHIKSVDFEPTEYRKLPEALQVEGQNLFYSNGSGRTKNVLSQCYARAQGKYATRREKGTSENCLFTIEIGGQKPYERQNRSATPQLERGMCGWLWLREDYARQQKTVCSSSNDGSNIGSETDTRMFGCPPHRWESIEQQHRQSSVMYQEGSQDDTQSASYQRGGKIKTINFSGTLPVWDIYVADDHSYWSEGCFSHNSKPNVQNLPSRGETGDRMRSLIKAPEGHIIIGADLSNIEARVLAYYLEIKCHDSYLANVFRSGDDFHDTNAASWGLERDMAKKVLYLTLYGGGAQKLADSAGISLYEAEEIFQLFHNKLPSIIKLKNLVTGFVEKHGYIRTLLGRHVQYPLIWSRDEEQVAKVHRQSFNALLQGSAADIIKTLSNRVAHLHVLYDVRGLIQVHDENLWLSKNDARVEKFMNEASEIWNSCELLGNLPIVAEFKIGTTWHAVH